MPHPAGSQASVKNNAGSTMPAAALLMALSGCAGLGNQMVWTAQFGVWLGHEFVSVLAVVAAFFGGLAIGAHALGRRIGASAHPGRWYAGCEALIACWVLVLTLLLQPANAWLLSLAGPQPSNLWHWSVAFLGPFFLLLPATCAMGATLPAIESVTNRLRNEGFAIGGLYAANTLGAVAGVLAAVFVLIPQVGLATTALLCAGMNFLCAVAALYLFSAGRGAAAATALAIPGARGGRLPALLFATGLLGIGYEVVVVRVLSQVAEDTVYTYAVLLAVYLLGTAGGALVYQRRLALAADAVRLRERLLAALCVAILISTLALSQSDVARTALSWMLGAGFGAGIAAEAAIALAAFALPTLVMGALFSHLCVQAKAAGWGFGPAIAINTLGAALAPALCGVVLLPWLGPKLLLITIACAYLVLVSTAQWKRAGVWMPALAGLAVALSGATLAVVAVPEGGHVVSYQEGVMAAVSVVEDADGVARLRINNRQQEGSSASGLTDARQAYLPLLLHPAPRSALLLGLGTGVTAAAAAEDGRLQVDAVELLPEVIAASAYFKPALPGAGAPHVIAGDARRYVRSASRRYDVVVADLFHPARNGAGALYTVEHFAAIKARLAPGGLFCQWLPLHQLDLATLRSIVRSFVSVYPGASAVLATNSLETPVLGLVARPDAAHFDLRQVRQRLADPVGHGRRAELHLADDFSLLGSFIAGPAALARFAAPAQPNTDDRPLVTHRAPYATYAPEALPRERLLALLEELHVEPEELVGAPGDALERGWQQRLGAYWAARNRFIEAGAGVKPHPDPRIMLAQVQQPLLEIVRMSADFSPAYEPLLNMAKALAGRDAEQARVLLAALAKAQPARPEAGIALEQLRAAVPGGRPVAQPSIGSPAKLPAFDD